MSSSPINSFIYINPTPQHRTLHKSKMGNTLGGKKTVKIMKITGETLKFKTPVTAGDILKDYPGLVLLESESVKHYGVRAKPLEAHRSLAAKRLYFLVELPKVSPEKPRRVRSGINMSAKDRLENLMLARRSVSDLSIMGASMGEEKGGARVKMRLPKAEVERLMKESKDEAEAAAKIMSLCMESREQSSNGVGRFLSSQTTTLPKPREKRVSFEPVTEAEIQIAVASY